MNTHELATTAADLMDQIEERYGDENDVEVGMVAVIAEVNYLHSDGDEITCVEYRCSDGRRWVQAGLFEAAKRGVFQSSETLEEEE